MQYRFDPWPWDFHMPQVWPKKCLQMVNKSWPKTLYYINSISLSFCLFWATPMAYEGSQARGLIGAIAAGLHLATAMPDPSHVCDLHQSSQQCQILNPLSEARDRTCVLMDASRIRYRWATMGTLWWVTLGTGIGSGWEERWFYFSVLFLFCSMWIFPSVAWITFICVNEARLGQELNSFLLIIICIYIFKTLRSIIIIICLSCLFRSAPKTYGG